MSDENRPPWVERSNKTEAMFIHYCMHKGYKKWDAWGFAGCYGIEWFSFDNKEKGEKKNLFTNIQNIITLCSAYCINNKYNYEGSNMNREEFLTYVTSTYNAEPEYLWEKTPNTCVFRHKSNNKWFCAVLTVKKIALNSEIFVGEDDTLIDIVDIKAHPLFINSLKEKKGILPGYHMNKEHWITVLLGDYLTDDEIKSLLEESYQLTK